MKLIIECATWKNSRRYSASFSTRSAAPGPISSRAHDDGSELLIVRLIQGFILVFPQRRLGIKQLWRSIMSTTGGRTKVRKNKKNQGANGSRPRGSGGEQERVHRIESNGAGARLEAKGAYARFVKKHRATSLHELQERRLIPAFVSIDRLDDAIRQTTARGFRSEEVNERFDTEMSRAGAAGNAWSASFKASRKKSIQTEVAVDAITNMVRGNRPKRSVELAAGRALALRDFGHIDVVEMSFPGRLEILTPTVVDLGITTLRADEVSIGRGSTLSAEASNFLLISSSLAGPGCVDVSGAAGASGTKGPDGGTGANGTIGRKAECKGLFGKDTPPTHGSSGSDGANGGAGGAGESGVAGGTWEIHTAVLRGGVCVHANGGPGGDGGAGGKGGDGGTGGKGGNGDDCEPSGNGGRGGDGGDGGKGGTAGNGGSAGRIFLYYVTDQSAALPPQLSAVGGPPGKPGVGGAAGKGGAAGAQGAPSDYGKAQWDPGPPKPAGDAGQPGAPGATGSPGAATAQNVVMTQVSTI